MMTQSKPQRFEVLNKTVIYSGMDFPSLVYDLVHDAVPHARVFAVITDSNLSGVYLPKLITAFENAGVKGGLSLTSGVVRRLSQVSNSTRNRTDVPKSVISYVIPPGEGSKTRATKADIEDFLLEKGCNRDTCIIAMGGGVVGDLVGFVASTYLRGVPLVQIPTTLLGMVDSSIGGKNGVDTPMGKNFIGTIYQPIRIYVNFEFLSTLPRREFANGMAEVVKTCVLDSEKEFSHLEVQAPKLSLFLKNENKKYSPEIQNLMSRLVLFCMKFKSRVVEEDEFDSGKRQLLNFGHTFGHALERHYTPYLLHGECVSIGMILEMEVGLGLKTTSVAHINRLKTLLHALNLPVSLWDDIIKERIKMTNPPTMDQLLRAMKLDKKNNSGVIHMVLISGMGNPFEEKASAVFELDILNSTKRFLVKKRQKSKILSPAQPLVEAQMPDIDNPISSSVVLIGDPAIVLAERVARFLGWTYLPEATIRNLEQLSSYHIFTLKKSNSNEKMLKQWIEMDRIVIYIFSNIEMTEIEFAKYEDISNYTYFFESAKFESLSELEDAAESLAHLVNYANGNFYLTAPPNPDLLRSFFVSLIVPDVEPLLGELNTIITGTHAIELRIDQLEPFKSNPNCSLGEFERTIARQVALIRNTVKDHPIIYTVRTKEELGGFDEKGVIPENLLEIFLYGIRLGCEFIDVQINLDPRVIERVEEAAANKSRIIASYHSVHKQLDWTGDECAEIVHQGTEFGDILKLVSVATSTLDNSKVQSFSEAYYASEPDLPLIAFNMGQLGRLTRCTNKYFTPVTHEVLRQYQNPALFQLTVCEVLKHMNDLGQIPSKQFYIFGHEISHSLSPIFHNINFSSFNLPYNFSIKDTNDIEEIKKVILTPGFGGAAVTMPHKETIVPHLDFLSKASERIKAVNTIIKMKDGRLMGDNTDWIGIRNTLSQILKGTIRPRQGNFEALLIGGGGTARAALYALYTFPFDTIYLINRTTSKLMNMVKGYPSGEKGRAMLRILNDQERYHGDPTVIVDTTPLHSGMCTNAYVNSLFQNPDAPNIFIKLAYGGDSPSETQEEALNAWITVRTGVDVFIEQALAQALRWTGFKPNREFLQHYVHTHHQELNATTLFRCLVDFRLQTCF